MSKVRTVLGVVLFVAVLLVAGACSSSSSSSSSSYCSKIKKYNSEGVTKDIQGQKAIAALEDVEKSAPSQIKSDIDYLVSVAKKLSTLDTNNLNELQSLSSSLDTDKLNSASKNVDSYTQKTCGISLTT